MEGKLSTEMRSLFTLGILISLNKSTLLACLCFEQDLIKLLN